MIKDTLQNAGTYYLLSKNLELGFEWLKNTDLTSLPDGKYEIKQDEIYANVQTYSTKDTAKYESHQKYIDIQYMINGKERIGIATHDCCKTCTEYNEEKDLEFYDYTKDTEEYITLESGSFAVFYPQDLHKPSINCTNTSTVKKVVVKVSCK